MQNQNTGITKHFFAILCITDAQGKLLAEFSYGAWGRARNPETWKYEPIINNQLTIINYRGYTGHEILPEFGIINIACPEFISGNGRLYDPVLGRMLSPDNYVQMPDYTQNFNRYSYVLNNPLKYTDPDGEFINLIIGGIIGGFMGYMAGDMAGATGWKLAGYIGVGIVAGALTSGVSAGVGSALGGGSFAAGFVGTSTVTASATFSSGAIVGAASGFTGGFVTGMGTGLLEGQTFGQSLKQGAKQGVIGGLIGGVIGGIAGITQKIENDNLNQELKAIEKQREENLAILKEKAIKEGFVTSDDIDDYEKFLHPERYYKNNPDINLDDTNLFRTPHYMSVKPKGYANYNITINLDGTPYIPVLESHPAWESYQLVSSSLDLTCHQPFQLALPEMTYSIGSINWNLFFNN